MPKKQESVIELPGGGGNKDELMEDLIAIITFFCSQMYGLRRSKRKTEKIWPELKSHGQ
ncbi:hypothetical protein [Coleofasciculus sp. E2-BRE-01]|uniref:hypothetical protein n=1 Tax=Coleofasciculus sp. E2-BRE-01 TaxID=3069524 RepID=UPI0032F2311C